MEITFSEKESPELFNSIQENQKVLITNKEISVYIPEPFLGVIDINTNSYEIKQVQKFRSSIGNKVTVTLEKI